ncbi:hypothetical protein AB0I68_04835 [Streptomyces sp. NPDC050448]|uniref:hypothetical protein n=1 Tax=Streptomyces sp. NPDC050448 TaxID=3155404 RepID=UPI0034377675
MTREKTGRIIGATFGLAFVQVNAAALPTAAAIPLRVLALIAFLAVLRTVLRSPAPPLAAGGDTAARTDFGRRYRYLVGAEVLAGTAGIIVINDLLHAPHAMVAWIALVVGLHFFGLAAVWRMPSLNRLAAAMSACGAVGLVLCACGSSQAAVAAVAGIVPGALLLGSVRWSLRAAAGPGAPAAAGSVS